MSEWRRICRVRACWSSVPRPGSAGASPSRRSARGHRWCSRPAAATSWRARSPKPAGASSWSATSGTPTTAPGSSTRPSPRSAGSTSWCSRPACRPLMPMEETPAETMHDVFATNAIGGLMLLTAAAGRLAEGGIVAYLGSDSVGAAYPGMMHYAASKAALDQGVDGLRMEFPETRFLRIAVGPTAGTAIALDYDPEIAGADAPADAAVRARDGEVHDRDRSRGAHRRAARPRAAPPRHRGRGHRDPAARRPGPLGHRPRRCRPRRTRRSPSPRAPARSGWTSSTPPRTGRSPPRCASG